MQFAPISKNMHFQCHSLLSNTWNLWRKYCPRMHVLKAIRLNHLVQSFCAKHVDYRPEHNVNFLTSHTHPHWKCINQVAHILCWVLPEVHSIKLGHQHTWKCNWNNKLIRDKRTPDIKSSHIKSPYWETTSLHSALTTPSAPMAWLISVMMGWKW
jgi:hypothetical protein